MFHSTKLQQILLIEDNAAYGSELVGLLQAALGDYLIDKVADNEQATEYLMQAVRPDLMLWSVEAMQKDNFITIAQVKCNPLLKEIPVVALADDCNEKLILHCYSLGIKAYVVKPTTRPELVALLRTIESFHYSKSSLNYLLTHFC